MAGSQVAQNTQQGDYWSGMLKAADIPAGLQNNGIDELGKLAYIHRGHTRFLNDMIHYFPKAANVGNREIMTVEVSEYDRVFNVTGASVGGDNHTTITVTNDQAAQLEINDTLFLKSTLVVPVYQSLSSSQVVAGGSNVGPELEENFSVNVTSVLFNRNKGLSGGNYFYDYETVLLVDKSAPNVSTGQTTLTLHRCFQGGGRLDKGGRVIPTSIVNTAIAADTANATIQIGDQLIRMLPAWTEGSNYPNGFWKAPVVDNNFSQEFKYAFSVTLEHELNKSFSPEDAKTIKRKLLARRTMLDIERNFLFSKKSKSKDAQGKLRYTMGGVVEHIIKDEDHIIKHTGADIDYGSMQDTGEKIFALGGGETRTLYMSWRLLVKFKKAFYGHPSFRFNRQDTARFDVPVESLIVPGGELNLVPLYCMDEAGYVDDAICIDWTVPCYQPVTHKGFDMIVKKNLQDNDSSTYKAEILSIKALRRQYAQYQSIVSFA